MARDGSPARERLIAAMCGSRTVSDAAVTAGISSRTAYRILNRPGVRDRIAQAREQAFAEGGALLRGLFGEAVELLARLARGSREDEIRCRAARSLVELAIRYDQAVVIARQVAAQEARLDCARSSRRSARQAGSMKDLGPRIEAVEDKLAHDDEPHEHMPVKMLVSERSFQTAAELQRWSAQHAAEGRARARAVESESVAALRLVVVRRCAAGEQPSSRERGPLVPVPAKATSGEVPA